MTLCLLHPTKSAANYATSRNLLLLYIRNNPAIMIQSLLLVCVRDAPAIMMAPLANFSFQLIVENQNLLLFCVKDAPATTTLSLQLIVESLLLLCDFKRPVITAVTNGNFFFKFIVESISEGARFAPNFDGLSNLNSSKLIVNFSEISFHFCEDYRIFREGKYQYKVDNNGQQELTKLNKGIHGPFKRNGLIDLVGRMGLVGLSCVGNYIGLVFGPKDLVGNYIGLVFGPKDLVDLIGHNGRRLC
jgi:hypothetical protein